MSGKEEKQQFEGKIVKLSSVVDQENSDKSDTSQKQKLIDTNTVINGSPISKEQQKQNLESPLKTPISDESPKSNKSEYSLDYLSALLCDRECLDVDPNAFQHVKRILNEGLSSIVLFNWTFVSISEIYKVQAALFQINLQSTDETSLLPLPEGEIVSIQEQIFVPVDLHPDVWYS